MGKRTRPAPKKRRQAPQSSLVIPAIVGLVVVGVLVAAILAQEQSRSAASAAPIIPTDLPIRTVEPLSTAPPPYPEVPRIARSDLLQKMEAGEGVIVVDVRGKDSYDQMHIPGSLSIPEDQLLARLDELPPKAEIVLYCA